MNPKAVIVDYGIGNVKSVLRTVQQFTKNCELTNDPQKILSADRLILPGDGAFGDSMIQLKKRGLVKPILDYISKNKPFLGICVGMQVLATTSTEFGLHNGLNIIPGKVIQFPKPSKIKEKYKIPQIGWNKLILPPTLKSWKGTIFDDIKNGDWVYFIHSYIVVPKNSSYNLALTNYGDNIYSAAITKRNVTGCQFHPEKSGKVGLNLLKKFIQRNNEA